MFKHLTASQLVISWQLEYYEQLKDKTTVHKIIKEATSANGVGSFCPNTVHSSDKDHTCVCNVMGQFLRLSIKLLDPVNTKKESTFL